MELRSLRVIPTPTVPRHENGTPIDMDQASAPRVAPDGVAAYVIDDHDVVREGLRLSMAGACGVRVIGVSSNPEEGLAEVGRLTPEIVILDLLFDGKIRIDLVRSCRSCLPKARIIVFSSLSSRDVEERCLQAGADIYLSKERNIEDLIGAALQISSSRPPDAGASQSTPARSTADVSPPLTDLTRRERQIAKLLGQGATIAQISSAVGISKKTAAVHADNIRRKLGCANSRQLVILLAKLGELDA